MEFEASTNQELKIEEYPTLGDRVQSTFIDTLVIVGCMFLFAAMLDRYEDVPDWVRATLFLGIWFVYEPLCTSLGCSLGQYLKGIRVRESDNISKRINIFQALFRYLIKMLLGWISFLTIGSNREQRAIHDIAVGSVVVKAEVTIK